MALFFFVGLSCFFLVVRDSECLITGLAGLVIKIIELMSEEIIIDFSV